MRPILCMTTLALALSLVAAPASAAAPTAKDAGSRLELTNGHVLVSFDGKKPILHVFPGGDAPAANATGAFTYRFVGLVESRAVGTNATPANATPTDADVVSRLDLAAASWNVTLHEVDGLALVDLSAQAPVQMVGGLPASAPGGLPALPLPDRTANVSLVFAIRDADAKLGLGNVDLAVPSDAIAFELQVHSWPFVDATNDRLSLETSVSGAVERAAGAGVDSGAVRSNGTLVGGLAWPTVANATGANGAPTTVPVKTALHVAANATSLVHTFDAPDLRTIAHHGVLGLTILPLPTTTSGLASGIAATKTVPMPGAMVAVAAVGALAVTLRRFRGGP